MATTVGSHSVSTFATPVNGGPLDANVVRGNDNTIRSAYVAHDADTGIHVQSSTLANRPAAGTAGRKWITADTGIFKLWYDDGTTWHEVGTSTIDVYVLADENLVKGDIVKVTGYNVGNGAPRVAKVSSAADVAFGIVNGTIAANAVGYVTNTGLIIDLNTNAFATGDILYPNTSGGLTITKPSSGNYQPVAFVLRANTNNGVLFVEFSTPRFVEVSANTSNTVVRRGNTGEFSAGAITATSLTSTGPVTFASLQGTGATAVTDILNDGTMATASATTLATSASIKTYVDSQVDTVDTLAEVLANGNTTGTNNIIVTNNQKITTNTIDETSSGVGVTIDSVLLKDNEVTATGLKVTNLKANDGAAAGSIANSTGVVTLASSVLTTTDINGGTVDGVTIGAAVAGAATFTNITSAGTINLTGATVSNGGSVTTIDINGGTIDGTTIGGNSAAAGTFTTINATSINATTFDMTNLEVTNIKAKDGQPSMTIADTSGDVTVSAALIANGNVTLGSDTADSITVNGIFPTGTKLRTGLGVGNTLAIAGYTGTTYVDLITATAATSPTLTISSTGTGSMNNIAIGGSTPAAGAFTTLGSSGDFAVATNKFTVASATGNTAVAGTLTTEDTLTSNGNTVLGSAATDTITATAQFVTGTQLKSAQSANNTLALSAYDVNGTAYVDLVKLTAGNDPTLTLNSIGTGTLDGVDIGNTNPKAGAFTTLAASGNFTLGADVVLSRGAANRLDLASGDSMNVVSGDYQIGGTSVLNSTTLGSGVTASSLTSVGTLSSLTVSGDLTVDTSTLKVDSTNNRVGIGAAPATNLHVTNSGLPGMRFTLGSETRDHNINATNNGRDLSVLPFRSLTLQSGNGLAEGVVNINAYEYIDFGTGSSYTFRARLDASGNLGLGVTPSAWGSAYKAFQFATTGSLYGESGDAAVFLGCNVYLDTGHKYRTSDFASQYNQENGVHKWLTAPSGTAGNTISFTQAMTLDASANLILQQPSAAGTNNLTFKTSAGTTVHNIRFSDGDGSLTLGGNGSAGNFALLFNTGNTERARITSGGDFLIGDTSGTHKLTVSVASGADRELAIFGVTGASNGFRVQWNHATLKTRVSITDIPTSSAGLPAGTLYSDGGTIKIA